MLFLKKSLPCVIIQICLCLLCNPETVDSDFVIQQMFFVYIIIQVCLCLFVLTNSDTVDSDVVTEIMSVV